MIRGIVLAAGMGRRMGLPKALVTLEGETFHGLAVNTLRSAGIEIVTVVNPMVARALPSPNLDELRVVNHDPDQESGMFSSVRLGVAEAMRLGAEGAVLLPVDHPFVTLGDVQAVVNALRAGADIVVPIQGGRRGHPIGISRSVMAEIEGAPHDATLRDIVRRDPGRVVETPASEGCRIGINTRDDLERASNRTFR